MAQPLGGAGLTLIVAAALTLAAGVGCRRGAREARDVGVTWNTASAPIANETIDGDLTLRDAGTRPVLGARLELQAFMPHPGMAPVVATVSERGGGVYRAQLRFTMPGPWTLLVKGTLPDGRTLTRQIDIPEVRSAPR